MTDILIDLGSDWGHIVQLNILEQIVHIEITPHNHLRVTCHIPHKSTYREFQFQSRNPFSDQRMTEEKTRLLGFTNGIINNADMKSIVKNMEAQTGQTEELAITDPSYDMEYVRRVWATMHGNPFFRFTLHYDQDQQTVLVNESHNDKFATDTLPEWLDNRTLQIITDPEDRLLMFAYEVIYRMVEPILPEPVDGAFTDPAADIPVMGGPRGPVSQQVDLTNISSDNVVASL